MKKILSAGFALALASIAAADVKLTDTDRYRAASRSKKGSALGKPAAKGAPAARAGSKAAKGEKAAKSRGGLPAPSGTGGIPLVDSGGLNHLINTNITFTTSSSASGAMSEASFTGPISATTVGAGTVNASLGDAFDGYNALCFSTTGLTGPCTTAAYQVYNFNAPASFDVACPGSRQVVFPPKAMGSFTVQRKVYVPSGQAFARWLDIFTNTTGAPATLNVVISNNLGSDANTRVVATSSGDATATTADHWVTSFQNYTGTTSTDVRLGHVLWGPGAATPPSVLNFVNGDDNPYWTFPMTLAAGETKILMRFVVGRGSNAASAAAAAALVADPSSGAACMTATERQQVVNFAQPVPVELQRFEAD